MIVAAGHPTFDILGKVDDRSKGRGCRRSEDGLGSTPADLSVLVPSPRNPACCRPGFPGIDGLGERTGGCRSDAAPLAHQGSGREPMPTRTDGPVCVWGHGRRHTPPRLLRRSTSNSHRTWRPWPKTAPESIDGPVGAHQHLDRRTSSTVASERDTTPSHNGDGNSQELSRYASPRSDLHERFGPEPGALTRRPAHMILPRVNAELGFLKAGQ